MGPGIRRDSRIPKLAMLANEFFVAGGPGFEPRLPGPEPGVLPLNYPPTATRSAKIPRAAWLPQPSADRGEFALERGSPRGGFPMPEQHVTRPEWAAVVRPIVLRLRPDDRAIQRDPGVHSAG